jgi:hypothetical protein
MQPVPEPQPEAIQPAPEPGPVAITIVPEPAPEPEPVTEPEPPPPPEPEPVEASDDTATLEPVITPGVPQLSFDVVEATDAPAGEDCACEDTRAHADAGEERP